MAAVGDVLKPPIQLYKPTEDASPRFWTDVKVKQAWLGALAFALAAGAVVATALTFSVSLWFLAAAVPLFLAAGGSAWIAAKMIDYDDPRELAKVRDACAKMPLMEIASQHGWERIFRYQILSPAQFDEAYRKHVDPMPLRELIAAYRFCSRKINEARVQDFYRLPSPSVWREKLERETNGFNFNRLINNYSLADLIQYELLSPATFNRSFIVFADGAPILEIIKCHNLAKAKLRAAHADFNPQFIQQFMMPSPEAWKEKFSAEWGEKEASDIAARFSQYLPSLLEYRIVGQEEYSILARAKRECEIWEERTSRANREMNLRLQPYATIRDQAKEIADRTYNANSAHAQIRLLNEETRSGEREIEFWFSAQKRNHPHRIAELRRERAERFDLLHCRMNRLKAPYEMSLANARLFRNGAYSLADAGFEAMRSSFEAETGREISRIARERDIALAAIDLEYRQLQGREISLP